MSKSSEKNKNQATKKAEEQTKIAPDQLLVDSSASGEIENNHKDGDPQDTPTEKALSGLPWQVAQLATSLLAQSPNLRSPASLESRWEDEYWVNQVREAIRKSRIVLELSTNAGDEKTWLSTWFEPNSPLSIKEIESRLATIGWKTVGRKTTPNYGTIKSQIEVIEKKWKAKLRSLETQSSELYDLHYHAADLVTGALKELCSDESISSALPDLEKEAGEFLKKIHQGVIRSDSEIKTVDFERHRALYDWCFMSQISTHDIRPEQTVAAPEEEVIDESESTEEEEVAQEVGGDQKKNEKIEARFRIHELLRFAENQWDREVSVSALRNRLGELTDEEEEDKVARSNEWLPVHFRPRTLSQLDPSFAVPSKNCPLPERGSFEGFNSDGCKSPLEQYPWGA